MQRALPWPLLIAAMLVAGCGTPADRPAVNAPAPEAALPATDGVSAPEAAPEVALATDAPADQAPETAEDVDAGAAAPSEATRDPNRDFTPSDPATVQLAAGRPQLFEFFAHW